MGVYPTVSEGRYTTHPKGFGQLKTSMGSGLLSRTFTHWPFLVFHFQFFGLAEISVELKLNTKIVNRE